MISIVKQAEEHGIEITKFRMTSNELLEENARAEETDWITSLAPLLLMDLISLSLFYRGYVNDQKWSHF